MDITVIQVIQSIVQIFTSIVLAVVTVKYVKYTKEILNTNKESVNFGREQFKKNTEYQKEELKVSLLTTRIKIFCKWEKLIDDAKSNEKKEYSILDKLTLYNETKFLFSKESAEKLKKYLEKYELYCSDKESKNELIKDRKNEQINSQDKDNKLYEMFKNADNEICETLSKYLTIGE